MNWTKALIYLFLAMVLVAAVMFYRQIFHYLLYAFIVFYILDPFISWFERHHVPRWLSVLTLYLFIVGIIAMFTAIFLPDLITQGNYLFSRLSGGDKLTGEYILSLPFVHSTYVFLINLDKQIPGLDAAPKMVGMVSNVNSFLISLPKLLMDNFKTIGSAVSVIATVPFLSFFLLKDKYKLRKGLMSFTTNRYFELGIILLHKIDKTIGTYLRAVLFEVVAVGIMASIAFSIVGVPNALLIGATSGIANIIPYFGPLTGLSLAALSLLINGAPMIKLVYAALAMYIVQVVDNNIVYPVVVGGTINMHPLLVLLTVIAGGWYGGLVWMLIAVPMVYISFSLVKVLYLNLKEFRII